MQWCQCGVKRCRNSSVSSASETKAEMFRERHVGQAMCPRPLKRPSLYPITHVPAPTPTGWVRRRTHGDATSRWLPARRGRSRSFGNRDAASDAAFMKIFFSVHRRDSFSSSSRPGFLQLSAILGESAKIVFFPGLSVGSKEIRGWERPAHCPCWFTVGSSLLVTLTLQGGNSIHNSITCIYSHKKVL